MHPARPSQWSRELERFFLRSLAKRISQTWLNCTCNLAWLLHVRDLGLESSCHMTSIPDCFLQGEGVALSVLSIDLNWAKFAALTTFVSIGWFLIAQGLWNLWEPYTGVVWHSLCYTDVYYYAAVQSKENVLAVCSLNHLELCGVWSMMCKI